VIKINEVAFAMAGMRVLCRFSRNHGERPTRFHAARKISTASNAHAAVALYDTIHVSEFTEFLGFTIAATTVHLNFCGEFSWAFPGRILEPGRTLSPRPSV
jgi:hypothetical protein